MPAEPLTGAPTEQQIQQQVKKLCEDQRHMQGVLRRALLRWLIDFKTAGKYDQKPKPHAKQIYVEFYNYAVKELDTPPVKKGKPDEEEAAIVTREKKLFGELADALKDYYAGPGVSDSVIIKLQGGIGGCYEPQIELRPAPPIIAFASYSEQGDRDTGVISDNDFISGIEAKVPDGTTHIWVAAPDLSNVGDEMSPFSELVRRTVCENARRGIDYTYVFPEGYAGRSRQRKLKRCFNGTSGKLHLHEVPPERFYEITLVQAHFISFNPLSPAPDAYMQLPLSQAQKGWIKLTSDDAARVLAKMKSLKKEYPEKIDIEEPAGR